MRRQMYAMAAAALLAAACGGGSGATTTGAGGAPTTSGGADVVLTPAPDFTLALGTGESFTLSAEQKPVYLVFWAEW
jgi:cytochrome oxidase Cu insertion factor (SCO1/SenC/PrrC family)